MATLKNWTIENTGSFYSEKFSLHGNVYGHPRPNCPNGMYIHTTNIYNVEEFEEGLVLHTRNTEYKLFLVDCNISAQNMADLKSFAKEFGLDNFDKKIKMLMDKQQEKRENYITQLCDRLDENMLYLDLSGSENTLLALAVYKDSFGNCGEADHTPIDNCYSIHDPANELDVRYKITDDTSIEFCNTLFAAIPDELTSDPSGVVMGYIHNCGVMTLTVNTSWGSVIELNPGDEKKMVYGE